MENILGGDDSCLQENLENHSPTEDGWINKHFFLRVSDWKKMRCCRALACEKTFADKSTHLTFRRHWESKHKGIMQPKRTMFIFYDQNDTSRLVKLVIEEQLDHSFVESSASRRFCESLDENKNIIGRKCLSELISSCRHSIQQLIKDELRNIGSISCTFDL